MSSKTACPTPEIMALEQAGLPELVRRRYTVASPMSISLGDQQAVNASAVRVAVLGLLEEVENLEPREGCLRPMF